MENNKDRVFLGIACCLAAHFLFFIMGWSAKYLSATHNPAEIAFFRNLLVFIPFIAFIVLRKKIHILKTKEPKLITFRAIIGGISLIITYTALAYLPMAYATVLFFASTILTPALSFILLKEQVGIHRWGAVALGMLGVYIIAQPSGEFSTFGMTLALIAATLHAIMFVVLRRLKNESSITVTFYFILGGTIIPGLMMPWIYSTPTSTEIPIFLLVAASGGIAQICLANAYKFAPASVVTPFAYSALIWSLLADIFYWGFELDLLSVFIGAGFIITAQLYILLREYLNREKKQ